ncbi:hypothetical protein C8R46DRAFT_884346 [Mycena filopes]|nr:hypothetical protein C8R46DRAFT_884346 [Mycena filopes]
MDNLEAVYSVLCDEESWHWDDYEGHKLIFHTDGTGEITSLAEMHVWIVAIFEWKVHDPTAVQYHPEPTASRGLFFRAPEPPILRTAIEFTLTKQTAPLFGRVLERTRYRMNEDILLDAAFEPRVLNITVEQGRFALSWPRRVRRRTLFEFGGDAGPRFRTRLTFDVSPYPPREAWRPDQYSMVNSMGQLNMTQFCARELAPEREGCVVM